MMSLMLDYAIGGRPENLGQFHRTSLLLHAINTGLLTLLLYLLFGRPWVAGVVGLLFGVHPMTVETIPWVSERKTLLAAFFCLLCLILYVRHTRKGGFLVYVTCLIMFLLALMSKPTSTPLPILMLLMDYWPLRRWTWRTFLEKVPFFVFAAISGVITLVSQTRTVSGSITWAQTGKIPLILCHNIVFYLWKIFWPADLCSHYAFPEPLDVSHPMVLAGLVGSAILIPALLISVIWTRELLAGWAFFFVGILPSTQIIRFSNVIAADKFAYLPSIGLLMVLASLSGRLWDSFGIRKATIFQVTLVLAGLVLASGEAVASRRHLAHWCNTETLYSHMVTVSPNSVAVRNHLGVALVSVGKIDEGIEQFRTALQIKPGDVKSNYNLGLALKLNGKFEEAINCYQRALEQKPDYAEVYNNLGSIFHSQGKYDEAISHYRRALQIKPDFEVARKNLDIALGASPEPKRRVGH
jgi:hypothetical protein